MGGKVLELTSERLIEQAEDKSFLLINRLIADGRNDEIPKVCNDKAYREKLFKEYGL